MNRRKEVEFGDDYVHGLLEVEDRVYDCCCQHHNHHHGPSATTNDGDADSAHLSENGYEEKSQSVLQQRRVM